jgi:hypothetical protein
MTLEEGCVSLKLECALRDLGFVEIGWRVVAHAGIFFIEPIGWSSHSGPSDDLLGFQIQKHIMARTSQTGLRIDIPVAHSAKRALDLAFSLS